MRRSFYIVRWVLIVAILLVPDRLWSLGASDPCPPIVSPLTYARLQALLSSQSCRSLTLEEVLARLPPDFRSRYVLVYDSQSSQGATPLFPRVIMFGMDAKFIIAFAGDPTLKGYNRLETIEFNDHEKRFMFRKLEFETETAAAFTVHENSTGCKNCHAHDNGLGAEELRPNFDLHGAWPGVFLSRERGRIDGETEAEKIFYQKVYQKLGRYKYLEDHSKHEGPQNETDYFQIGQPNTGFTWLLSRLNARVNARWIKNRMARNPNLWAARYALVGAMTCRPNFKNAQELAKWIPPDISSSFRSYEVVYAETVKDVERSYKLREERQCAILKSLPISEAISFQSCTFPRTELTISNGAIVSSTSRVRYIMEGVKESMEPMSLEFAPKQHARSSVFYAGPNMHLGGLDLHLWREVLDKTDDSFVYEIFNNAKKDFELELQINGIDLRNLCSDLSRRSLQSFRESQDR